MKLTAKVDFYCASGFYCKRNGNRLYGRLHEEDNRPYCELFIPFLETDSAGNVLKCEDCLLLERETRVKG